MSDLPPLPRPALLEPLQAHPDLPGVSVAWRVIGIAEGTDEYTAPHRCITIHNGPRAFELHIEGELVATDRVLRRLRRRASELECAFIIETEDRRIAAEVDALSAHLADSAVRAMTCDPHAIATLSPLPFSVIGPPTSGKAELACLVHVEGVGEFTATPSEVESAMRLGFAAHIPNGHKLTAEHDLAHTWEPLHLDAAPNLSRIELVSVKKV